MSRAPREVWRRHDADPVMTRGVNDHEIRGALENLAEALRYPEEVGKVIAFLASDAASYIAVPAAASAICSRRLSEHSAGSRSTCCARQSAAGTCPERSPQAIQGASLHDRSVPSERASSGAAASIHFTVNRRVTIKSPRSGRTTRSAMSASRRVRSARASLGAISRRKFTQGCSLPTCPRPKSGSRSSCFAGCSTATMLP